MAIFVRFPVYTSTIITLSLHTRDQTRFSSKPRIGDMHLSIRKTTWQQVMFEALHGVDSRKHSISQRGVWCLLDTLFQFWTPYFICHLHVKVL